jgi:hypothetical protein
MLAWMCYRLGDRERGRELHEENLRRARSFASRRVETSTLEALATIAVDDGRVDDAVAYLRDSHRIPRDRRDRTGLVRHLCRDARVLAACGQPETAAVLLASAEARLAEMGVTPRPWLADLNARTNAEIAAKLSVEAVRKARERGRGYDADQALALALAALVEPADQAAVSAQSPYREV